MYIRGAFRYYEGTEQRTSRAPFLILAQKGDDKQIYAFIRLVALRQLGHWMMGSANINGKWKTVSGSYGNDGLPIDLDELPLDAKPIPAELYDAWNKGEGWNSAGKEAPLMRDWALLNLHTPIPAHQS
jgi:hypothetical protein